MPGKTKSPLSWSWSQVLFFQARSLSWVKIFLNRKTWPEKFRWYAGKVSHDQHYSIYCTTVTEIRSYGTHPLGQTVPKRTRTQDSTSQHSALSVLQLFIESKVTGPAMRHHPHQMVLRQNSPLAAVTLRTISKHCLYFNISYLCYFFSIRII